MALMGLWRQGGPAWELSRLPSRVGQAIALRSSPTLPGESLPPAFPDLPGLRGADLFWPPLLLPPWSHYILSVHSGVPPISLGVSLAAVAGRCLGCGEMLTLHANSASSHTTPPPCMSFIYILDINPVSVISFANVFSHSVHCLLLCY